jgi:2-C-methyl-D-erythritol 2,4-cyclodiphosphate synthase
MDSSIIVNRVLEMMNEKNYHIENVDISIVLEKPKLRPYIDEIRRSIASVLKIDIDSVSFKAQTNELVDAVGLQKAVDCYCAILLEKN